jgi:hypothetical protein
MSRTGLARGIQLQRGTEQIGQLSLLNGAGLMFYSANGYTQTYGQHSVTGTDIGIGGTSGSFCGDGA